MNNFFHGCSEYRNIRKYFHKIAVSHDYTMDKFEEETLLYVAGYTYYT